MNYNKKIFRSHYGQLYFRLMYWGTGIALLLLQLVVYPHLLDINVPSIYTNILITVLFLIILLIIPVSGFLYFDCQRRAKTQQQWIDKNHVYYRIEKRKALTLLKSLTHTLTYKVQNFKEVSIDNRFIYIRGSIKLLDESDEGEITSHINELKIPRCFSKEEEMMKVLKIKF